MDRYTKCMLSVIAASLAFIAVGQISVVSNAIASTGAVEVRVVEMNLSQFQPIPVKVQGKLECDL